MIQQPTFSRKVRHLFYFEAAGEADEEVVVNQACPHMFCGDRIVADDDFGGRETTFALISPGIAFGPFPTAAFPRESVIDVVKAIKMAREQGYHAVADKIERDFLSDEDILRSELLLESDRKVALGVWQSNSTIAVRVRFSKKGTWRMSLTGWCVR